MTIKKKIIIGIVCTVAALFLMFVLFIVWLIFGDSIKIKVQTVLKTPAAKAAAREYIKEKYGDTPQILEVKPITQAKGFMFASGSYFAGFSMQADGYNICVFYDDYKLSEKLEKSGCFICDNRQYGDICAAVEKRFFDNVTLGSSYEVNSLNINFDECSEQQFTSKYFDGDIIKFLSEAAPTVNASVTYEGYPEKRAEYRELLNDSIDEIYGVLGENKTRVSIFVHDPSLNLPEVKNKYEHSSRIYHIPRYEKYMELIACGYTSKDGVSVLQTEWYEIDEYTAISSDIKLIVSNNEFVFEQVDLSYNTTAYRGLCKYDDRKNENILKIRDIGYNVDFTDKRSNGNEIFLRLDREHYKITDKTIPLLVADGTGNWQGKRLYTSVGYGEYDSKDEDWYYLDNDYLYLYIHGTYVDGWNAYLTFSDFEMPV